MKREPMWLFQKAQTWKQPSNFCPFLNQIPGKWKSLELEEEAQFLRESEDDDDDDERDRDG